MSLTYRGTVTFRNLPDQDSLDVDLFGMDRLTRTYAGNRALLAEWLKTAIKINKPDTEFKQLTQIDYSVSWDRSWSTVRVNFAGLLKGAIPDPRESAGWTRNTIQLQAADGTQTSVDYNAPTTTFKYITKTVPRHTFYHGRIIQFDQAWEVFSRRGARGGRIVGANPGSPHAIDRFSQARSNDFKVRKEIYTAAFNLAQVGLYWEVTETNEGRYVDAADDIYDRAAYGGIREAVAA